MRHNGVVPQFSQVEGLSMGPPGYGCHMIGKSTLRLVFDWVCSVRPEKIPIPGKMVKS